MHLGTTSLSLLLLLRASCSLGVVGAVKNVTVDDNDSTIVYSSNPSAPASDWNFGPTCTSYDAHVNASEAYGGTWHDTYFDVNDPPHHTVQTAEFQFTGEQAVSCDVRSLIDGQ